MPNIIDILSTRKEKEYAARKRSIIEASAGIPSGHFTVEELNNLLALWNSTFGPSDDDLDALERKVEEFKNP